MNYHFTPIRMAQKEGVGRERWREGREGKGKGEGREEGRKEERK